MNDKKFNAILAKNGIAQEIANEKREDVSFPYIIGQLKVIEAYLGEANQPNIDEILGVEDVTYCHLCGAVEDHHYCTNTSCSEYTRYEK